jgi:hypothetical protein
LRASKLLQRCLGAFNYWAMERSGVHGRRFAGAMPLTNIKESLYKI